jgi:hypothetical protein
MELEGLKSVGRLAIVELGRTNLPMVTFGPPVYAVSASPPPILGATIVLLPVRPYTSCVFQR